VDLVDVLDLVDSLACECDFEVANVRKAAVFLKSRPCRLRDTMGRRNSGGCPCTRGCWGNTHKRARGASARDLGHWNLSLRTGAAWRALVGGTQDFWRVCVFLEVKQVRKSTVFLREQTMPPSGHYRETKSGCSTLLWPTEPLLRQTGLLPVPEEETCGRSGGSVRPATTKGQTGHNTTSWADDDWGAQGA
jgi:hypothetical protein